MASRETFQELRRRLALVARLRGAALTAAEGVCLVEPRAPLRVRDPRALLRACATGRPTIAALTAAVDLEDPPLLLRPSLLATMRRNLKALAHVPDLADTVAESRALRRHGIPDAAWLAEREAFLQQLSERHRGLADAETGGRENAHLATSGDQDPPGARRQKDTRRRGRDGKSVEAPREPPVAELYARARALCAELRGEAAATALDAALERLRDDARERRRRARRRLAALIAALERATPPVARPVDPALAAAIESLRGADRLPGRSRRRRLAALVAAALELPPPAGDGADPEAHSSVATGGRAPVGAGGRAPAGDRGPPPDGRRPLADEVRALGEGLCAAIRPAGPALLDDARRFLALYGLAFRPEPRDGGPLALTPATIRKGLDAQDALLERLGGLDLTIDEALALHSARLGHDVREVAELVAGGLPVAAVLGLVAADRGGDLRHFRGDPPTAAAYARWALALGPHYKAMGLDSPLLPEVFRRIAGKKADLGVLALCLMNQSGDAGALGAERAIARLDATLGLFARRPAEIGELLADLGASAPGAGRAAFPGFAAWLDDDPLLDRVVHLSRLAGRPTALSRRLLSDYERGDALGREEAALSAMSDRTDRQEARLRRLQAGEVALPDPAWTRRRLHEEALALHAAAYDAQLAAVFRRILRDAFGLEVAALTPAWRDAIRFYLATDRNHGLLREVLRAAATGEDLDRSAPANRAWIARARERFAVDAWLAPRGHTVTIDGHPCALRIERDPVEILRMGVPFATCLSITTGFNAASTVINALDSNKRVIYLRDRKGAILARLLVAIASDDDAILTYHLYIADRAQVGAITAAFVALVRELAAATGLPLRAHGVPAQLHEGFWYDDGPEPLATLELAAESAVTVYCAALGVPTPRTYGDDLRREAGLHAAVVADDLPRIAAALGRIRAPSPLRDRAIDRLRGRVDDLTFQTACPEDHVNQCLAAAWRGDPRPLIDAAADGDAWRYHNVLSAGPPGPTTATLLVEAALARRRRGVPFNDHALEHQSLHCLPSALRRAPVALGLALAGRIEPVWAWIAACEPSCAICVECGRDELESAIVAAYDDAPDPEVVRDALADRRAAPLRRRVALAIAARRGLGPGGAPSPGLARVLHRLGGRAPELRSEPDFIAALLRQCAGALPHGVVLSTAGPGPFEALSAACLTPAIAAHLGPWLARAEVAGFSPGPWELALRRRRPTPIVAALAANAARWAPGSSPAALWLARLGEVAALEALDEGPPGVDAGTAAPDRPNLSITQLLTHARGVAAQLAALDGDALRAGVKVDVVALKRSVDALGHVAFDPVLVRAARSTIDRIFAGEADERGADARGADEREAELAASILEIVHPSALYDLLERISRAPRGPLPPALLRVARRALSQVSWQWHSFSPRLALDLADRPELRGDVLDAIVRRFDSDLDTAPLTLAAAAGDDPARAARAEALIDELCARALAAHGDDVGYAEGPIFRRCLAHALAPGQARATLTEIYQRIDSPSRAVELLDALDDEARRDPALRRAVLALELGDDLDHRVVREWLCLRVDPPITAEELSDMSS